MKYVFYRIHVHNYLLNTDTSMNDVGEENLISYPQKEGYEYESDIDLIRIIYEHMTYSV